LSTQQGKYQRTTIESEFPLREVSRESVREKSIRAGHISSLHIWWARRPLASSRASIYLALTNDEGHEVESKRLKFAGEFANWDNSNNLSMIEKARDDILASNGGIPPKVLDPFAGGGSIPLEALRLGCETYASDLNPIAVLLNNAILVIPQQFGKDTLLSQKMVESEKSSSLLSGFTKWSSWVVLEARKELSSLYPKDKDGGEPVGYLWTRTVKCTNPTCRADVPLVRQTKLANKPERQISYEFVAKGKKDWEVKISSKDKSTSETGKGTVARARAVCLHCHSALTDKEVRLQFQNGTSGERMIIVIKRYSNKTGKAYRPATNEDIEFFEQSRKLLERKVKDLEARWNMEPVPDESTPPGGGTGAERAFAIYRYGMKTWGDLFNARQKLSLLTFTEKVREAHDKIVSDTGNEEYARAISIYLGIMIDKLATKNSNLVVYNVVGEKIEQVFARQAIGMVWDYVELNPFTDVGWHNMQEWVEGVIKHCEKIPHVSSTSQIVPKVSQSSATSLSFGDNFFDAIITDPPYYDNVPYSYLSDFFYVWLKRSIGYLLPELFSTPLTPKSEEIVAYSNSGGLEEGKKFFEKMLEQAFKEFYRVLKPNGIVVIVFAHKTTAAWETMIRGLLASKLYLTASWPINTEREGRLRSQGSAALASSIYMICRKRTNDSSAYFNDVKSEIQRNVTSKLDYFWNHDIRGSDFFVSAIGPAVEVFGRYSRVEKLSGDLVSVAELLEYVQKVVSEFALQRILKTPNLGGVDNPSRFYLLWRWVFNSSSVQFDEARKLSQAIGVELADLWSNSFVVKEKEMISVRDQTERGKDTAFSKKEKYETLIDALQFCLIQWDKGNKEKIRKYLEESGLSSNEIFWQYAQAVSEVLPNGDKEKLSLQGFLYGKKSLVTGAKTATLLDYGREK
jgi:putative DNA methylase